LANKPALVGIIQTRSRLDEEFSH